MAAQQPQLDSKGQRPEDIAQVLKRMRCPCGVSSANAYMSGKTRSLGKGVIAAQAAPQDAQRAGHGEQQKNDRNVVETQFEGMDSDIGRDPLESPPNHQSNSPTKQRRGDVRYFLAQAVALLFEIPGRRKGAYADHDAT